MHFKKELVSCYMSSSPCIFLSLLLRQCLITRRGTVIILLLIFLALEELCCMEHPSAHFWALAAASSFQLCGHQRNKQALTQLHLHTVHRTAVWKGIQAIPSHSKSFSESRVFLRFQCTTNCSAFICFFLSSYKAKCKKKNIHTIYIWLIW